MKHHVEFELEFKKNPYSGKFIVLEGVDASGKTTHALALVESLKSRGFKAVYTKEPTNGIIGALIRRILNYEISVPAISLQYLFCADRAVHQEEIIKYLKEGYVVVSDRYFWSAVAYGMADLNGTPDFYLTALSILSFYNQFLSPDHMFFLDVAVDRAESRILASHKHKELYDRREKLVKIDESYKLLIKKFKEEFTVIDANKPIAEVSQELFGKVEEILPMSNTTNFK